MIKKLETYSHFEREVLDKINELIDASNLAEEHRKRQDAAIRRLAFYVGSPAQFEDIVDILSDN